MEGRKNLMKGLKRSKKQCSHGSQLERKMGRKEQKIIKKNRRRWEREVFGISFFKF